MAFRRRTRFRRRARRAPWYKRKYNAMQMASKALSATRYIRGLVNSEMLHSSISGGQTFPVAGTILSLTNIGQGDTDSQRTGNSIFLRSLYLNLNVQTNLSNLNNQFLRLILFMDTQQISDTSPNVTDVLAGTFPNSPLNQANAGRFKIMKNWEFSLTNGVNPTRVINKYMKLWHHVRYNSTASTDIQKGGIYLLCLSDQPTNPPSMGYQIKLGYHDN